RVPTTLGWAWPSAVTAIPPVKSRYSRPSLSHTRTPSPRTSATGARLAVFIRCRSDSAISSWVFTVCVSFVAGMGVASSGLSLRRAPVSAVRRRGARRPRARPARTRPWPRAPPRRSEHDLGPDPLLGEQLEEDGVRDAPVDDVGLAGSAAQGAQRGL